MPKQILGLIGPKGSGKSTLAEQLWEIGGWIRQPFAGPLKSMIRTLLMHQGVADEHITEMINGKLKEVSTPFLGNRSTRHAMQTLGTEWGRNQLSYDLWIQVWLNSIQDVRASVVVEDVRFINEADAIKSLNGIIIRINRPEQRNFTDSHISEAEWRSIVSDYDVVNYQNNRSHMLQQLKSMGII